MTFLEALGWTGLAVTGVFIAWQVVRFFAWLWFGKWSGHKACGEHRFHCDLDRDHWLAVTYRDAQPGDSCQKRRPVYRRQCCRCGHITEVG